MKMRHKMACWQQILTILGSSSYPDSEWATIFAAFLDTWDNPYYIQTSTDPNIPIKTEYLVRPSKAFLESLAKGSATGRKTSEFLEPSSSSVPSSRSKATNPGKRRDTISHSVPPKTPSSGKRRDTIAHSVSGASAEEQRSLSVSTAKSQLKNPRHSEYAKIGTPRKSRESITKVYSKKIQKASASTDDKVANAVNRRKSRASVSTANSTKREESCSSSDDSNLSSTKNRDTCASQDVSTSKPHKCQESRASPSTTNTIQRSESCSSSDDPIFDVLKRQNTFALPKASDLNPTKTRDSCDLIDDVIMNPIRPRASSVSKTTNRRKSCVPVEDHKASSAHSIKRRNTCVSTNAPQVTNRNLTKRRDTVANPIKITQQPEISFPHGCEQSSDEGDDQLPLSKWLINMKVKQQQKPAHVAVAIQKQSPTQYCNALPLQEKRKRGRPSLQEKALQQARLEAELWSTMEQPTKPASNSLLIGQKKHLAERPEITKKTQKQPHENDQQLVNMETEIGEAQQHMQIPKKHQTKPLLKGSQKQLKESQKRLKALPLKKTNPHKWLKTPQTLVKPSTHCETIQQPQNLSKSSGKKKPLNSRLELIAPISTHHKKRTLSNVGVKAISAKTPLMPDHTQPKAINLKRAEVGESAEKDAGHKNNLSEGQSIRRPSHLCEHNYNMAVDNDSRRGQPVYASNKLDEDQLQDDDMELTSPVGGSEAGEGIQLIEDGECVFFDTPSEMFREVEEMERCLEIFNNKTPSEIDSQLVHTTEFFEKLTSSTTVEENKADLAGVYMGEKEELDYEDDDDDVLSVATSWDGLDDETPPEPKPVEKLQTAEQKPKPMSKPSKEAPERAVGAETPKVQNVKTFRIPKVNQEVLKTQPSVMRSLYERQETAKKNKQTAKHVSPLQVDPTPVASNRQQREEATAARRVKEPVPVFGPPYRVPSEATVPLVNASSKEFTPQLPVAQPPQGNIWLREVFGVKCMQSLDNRCRTFNCDHTLNSLGEVQRRLIKMDEEALLSAYRLMLRSFFMFQTYFTSFVDIFENRQLRQQLLYMVGDCRFYKDIAAPLLGHVYCVLQKCGMQEVAIGCIMEHLWLPSKAHKFRDMTVMVLNILSSANWDKYSDKLAELKELYGFEIPIENLITMLNSSLDQGEKFAKALTLITLHQETTCRNKTILSILSNRSENAIRRQSVPDCGAPLLVPPHAAGQPCPPFRSHPVVPNFREPPLPINAHNFNGNNGFHHPNHFPNNLITQYNRI
ncbi:protein deadlock isoform X1 [Drosophila biarmipes]|uniref:protein deadlock isoform X1 n=1 Tax=Drosophila biarmipes TaxID=125945 RepID=UPI0007E63079|nr:protein deadlock isoform X1 [Drosophila biarmipes]